MNGPSFASGGSTQSRRSKVKQRVMVVLLFIATYSIVASVGVIFATITYQGSKVVFQPQYPFINTAFLTQTPETLHVYKPRATENRLLEKQRTRIQYEQQLSPYAGNTLEQQTEILAQLEILNAEIEELEKQSQIGEIRLSEAEFRALTDKPSLEQFTYENFAYSAGGIGPAIAGTAILVVGSIAIALTLGILCAIYLNEYSPHGRFSRWVRLSVLNLAGVPSIVFGLFGFGIFVLFLGWGVSVLAGWFTLSVMVLPIVIASSQEAIRAVPNSFREGSLALGASKWTTIRTNVLPHALPGMLTSSILSIARVAGETAPIMFTAAFALRDQLPWEGLSKWSDFFFQGVMALPYHIYVVSSKIPQNEYTLRMQYGATFVFLVLIGVFALTSILLRIRIRQKQRW
ncbi:MAG: phosphate ABC transporter permease PstA [Opitutales bacterium]